MPRPGRYRSSVDLVEAEHRHRPTPRPSSPPRTAAASSSLSSSRLPVWAARVVFLLGRGNLHRGAQISAAVGLDTGLPAALRGRRLGCGHRDWRRVRAAGHGSGFAPPQAAGVDGHGRAAERRDRGTPGTWDRADPGNGFGRGGRCPAAGPPPVRRPTRAPLSRRDPDQSLHTRRFRLAAGRHHHPRRSPRPGPALDRVTGAAAKLARTRRDPWTFTICQRRRRGRVPLPSAGAWESRPGWRRWSCYFTAPLPSTAPTTPTATTSAPSLPSMAMWTPSATSPPATTSPDVFSPHREGSGRVQVKAGVCLAAGDPIGDVEAWPGAIEAWLQLTQQRAAFWRRLPHPRPAARRTTGSDSTRWRLATKRW